MVCAGVQNRTFCGNMPGRGPAPLGHAEHRGELLEFKSYRLERRFSGFFRWKPSRPLKMRAAPGFPLALASLARFLR
jgi:hypothetical protein